MSNQGRSVHLMDSGSYRKQTTTTGSRNQLQTNNFKEIIIKKGQELLTENYADPTIRLKKASDKITISAIDEKGNELSSLTYEFDNLSDAVERVRDLSNRYAFTFYIGDSFELSTNPEEPGKIPSNLFSVTGQTSPNIKSIYFGKCVEEIANNAFLNVTSLEEVNLKNGTLKSIGSNAFTGTHIKNIEIPKTVTTINAQAFMNCTYLETVTFDNKCVINEVQSGTDNDDPNDATTYSDNKLTCTLLANTFKGCTALKTVVLPYHITNIGVSAFENCTSLSEVVFSRTPSGELTRDGLVQYNPTYEVIGDSAFRNCTSLKIIELPVTINTIGASSFRGCTGIESIGMPRSMKTINEKAFKDCTALTSITLNSELETIAVDTFEGCENLETIYVYANKTTIDPDTQTDPEDPDSPTTCNAPWGAPPETMVIYKN